MSAKRTADELFSYTAPAGGHEPSILQVVDRRNAWCPRCGMIVRLHSEDIRDDDHDARALLDALNEEHAQ